MNNIIAILLAILGIVIFIKVLPFLVWLVLILLFVFVGYLFYVNYKASKIMKDFNKQQEETLNNGTFTYTTYDNRSDDVDEVIDVEFSESEEE